RLYCYVVPARVHGAWELTLPQALASAPLVMQITQEPHAVGGFVRDGGAELTLRDLAVRGEQVRFGLLYKGRLMAFEGTVAGDAMAGEVRARDLRRPWTARPPGARHRQARRDPRSLPPGSGARPRAAAGERIRHAPRADPLGRGGDRLDPRPAPGRGIGGDARRRARA